MDSLVQPFTSGSHLCPLGQQCFMSLQHTAYRKHKNIFIHILVHLRGYVILVTSYWPASFYHTSLYGQQAHVESDSLQQVCVFEQRDDESHNTSSSEGACNFVSETLWALEDLIQVADSRLQVYPCGQQCSWSSQHTAYRENIQPISEEQTHEQSSDIRGLETNQTKCKVRGQKH